MRRLISLYSITERTRLAELIFPEEHRHRFTSEPWTGGFRHFLDPKVVCLEHFRLREEPPPSSSQDADRANRARFS